MPEQAPVIDLMEALPRQRGCREGAAEAAKPKAARSRKRARA